MSGVRKESSIDQSESMKQSSVQRSSSRSTRPPKIKKVSPAKAKQQFLAQAASSSRESALSASASSCTLESIKSSYPTQSVQANALCAGSWLSPLAYLNLCPDQFSARVNAPVATFYMNEADLHHIVEGASTTTKTISGGPTVTLVVTRPHTVTKTTAETLWLATTKTSTSTYRSTLTSTDRIPKIRSTTIRPIEWVTETIPTTETSITTRTLYAEDTTTLTNVYTITDYVNIGKPTTITIDKPSTATMQDLVWVTEWKTQTFTNTATTTVSLPVATVYVDNNKVSLPWYQDGFQDSIDTPWPERCMSNRCQGLMGMLRIGPDPTEGSMPVCDLSSFLLMLLLFGFTLAFGVVPVVGNLIIWWRWLSAHLSGKPHHEDDNELFDVDHLTWVDNGGSDGGSNGEGKDNSSQTAPEVGNASTRTGLKASDGNIRPKKHTDSVLAVMQDTMHMKGQFLEEVEAEFMRSNSENDTKWKIWDDKLKSLHAVTHRKTQLTKGPSRRANMGRFSRAPGLGISSESPSRQALTTSFNISSPDVQHKARSHKKPNEDHTLISSASNVKNNAEETKVTNPTKEIESVLSPSVAPVLTETEQIPAVNTGSESKITPQEPMVVATQAPAELDRDDEYNRVYPLGHETVFTSGDGLLCALYAVMGSIRELNRVGHYIRVPTLEELRHELKTQEYSAALIGHTVLIESTGERFDLPYDADNNLLFDQLALVLQLWGERHRVGKFSLGCITRDGRNFERYQRKDIIGQEYDPFGPRYTIFVSNNYVHDSQQPENSFNHYSAIRPRQNFSAAEVAGAEIPFMEGTKRLS